MYLFIVTSGEVMAKNRPNRHICMN